MTKPLIIASVATIAEREAALRDMAQSIAPQIDRLYVYLNDRVAYLRDMPGNVVQLKADRAAGDMSDAGKFFPFFTEEADAYFIAVDDDLLYPPDFTERLIEGIERYDRQAVCSFHGRTFHSFPITSYYGHRPRKQHRCLGTVPEDVPVHVGGTGCMGWHSSTVQFRMEDFPSPAMADVHAAVKLQRLGVPCIVLSHEAGWIRHSDKITMSKTIAYRYRHQHDEQTRRINELGKLSTFAPQDLTKWQPTTTG